MDELEKEKYKFRDERAAWAKQIRDEARMETKFELLENIVSQRAIDHFELGDDPVKVEVVGKKMVVGLSDLHIGQTFYNFSGWYDSEIARTRLVEYAKRVIEIQKLHGATECFVVLLGDQISGNIHDTIAITNRENVMEQVELASQLIEEFIFAICPHFDRTEVHGVGGNHSRISRKEDALKDERLDSFIMWHLSTAFKHIDNVVVDRDSIDISCDTFSVGDKMYAIVHGDYDAFSESGVLRLSSWLKYFPYCVMMGHRHTSAGEFDGVKCIRCGSLAGSGDDNTVEHRMSGDASQTVLVCDVDGSIECQYPIYL